MHMNAYLFVFMGSSDVLEQIQREQAVEELVEVLDSRLFTALAEPVRIDLLKVIILRGRTDVATLASHLPQDRSVISRHLSILYEAGVLKRDKVQRHVYYELDPESCIGKFRALLERVESMAQICCPPGAEPG